MLKGKVQRKEGGGMKICDFKSSLANQAKAWIHNGARNKTSIYTNITNYTKINL